MILGLVAGTAEITVGTICSIIGEVCLTTGTILGIAEEIKERLEED